MQSLLRIPLDRVYLELDSSVDIFFSVDIKSTYGCGVIWLFRVVYPEF